MISPGEVVDLIKACEDVDHQSITSLSEEVANRFINRFPLEVLFRSAALQGKFLQNAI